MRSAICCVLDHPQHHVSAVQKYISPLKYVWTGNESSLLMLRVWKQDRVSVKLLLACQKAEFDTGR